MKSIKENPQSTIEFMLLKHSQDLKEIQMQIYTKLVPLLGGVGEQTNAQTLLEL